MDTNYFLHLLEQSNMPVIHRKKGTYLLYEGVEDSHIYIVKTGVVKLSILAKNGREFNVAYLLRGRFLFLLDEEERRSVSPYNVRIETEDTWIYKVERKIFWEWIHRYRDLQRYIYRYYRETLFENIEKVRDFSMNGKKGAFCAVLVRFIPKFGRNIPEGILIDFPITNEDFAGFC